MATIVLKQFKLHFYPPVLSFTRVTFPLSFQYIFYTFSIFLLTCCRPFKVSLSSLSSISNLEPLLPSLFQVTTYSYAHVSLLVFFMFIFMCIHCCGIHHFSCSSSYRLRVHVVHVHLLIGFMFSVLTHSLFWVNLVYQLVFNQFFDINKCSF